MVYTTYNNEVYTHKRTLFWAQQLGDLIDKQFYFAEFYSFNIWEKKQVVIGPVIMHGLIELEVKFIKPIVGFKLMTYSFQPTSLHCWVTILGGKKYEKFFIVYFNMEVSYTTFMIGLVQKKSRFLCR